MHCPSRLILILVILLAPALQRITAQSADSGGVSGLVAEKNGPVCVLPAVLADRGLHLVPGPAASKTAAAASTITVTYIDDDAGEPWPVAAKDAFEFAKVVWEQTVTSAVPILVAAHWGDLGGCTGESIGLGGAGAFQRWRSTGGPLPMDDTWYVDALADALAGVDLCTQVNPPCTGDPDIFAEFNKDCDDTGAAVGWYFGTDGNTPSGQIDFVSVVLHELGHGLGFAGAGNVTGGTGSVLRGIGQNVYPDIYDHTTEDGQNTSLLTGYSDGSPALKNALEGGVSGVFYDATNANAANGGSPARLFSPDPWEGGSSYSHLNESTFNGTINTLMTPYLATMEDINVVGSVTCGTFQDMGWTIAAASCDIALPVELAELRAAVDGRDVLLTWETASETNNAGFDVQHRLQDGVFRSAGFVPGDGATSERTSYEFRIPNASAGAHRFRLAQRDYDGNVLVLGEVDVFVELADSFELTNAYPNPFNPRTAFYLTAREPQRARVEVFDATGRTVEVLFDGLLEGSSRREITIEGSAWPSGVYVYRVTGESFAESRKVVLLR